MSDFDFAPSRGLSTDEAARRGQQAVAITSRGEYSAAASGRCVRIAEAVRRAVAATLEHRPEDVLERPNRTAGLLRTLVVNETSLESARAIAMRGPVPLILNFASARHPGGGFLRGALAQEESLCRASALYACLVGRAMYEPENHLDPVYTSWMIHSPEVPVFTDDDGVLLEEPWLASFLTAAAPNAKIALEREPARAREVATAMCGRVTRALDVAAIHGHRHLVLGAWGCGVFGNDPALVARAFRDALEGPFEGVFEEVVFAVLDTSAERRFIRPFVDLFHPANADRARPT